MAVEVRLRLQTIVRHLANNQCRRRVKEGESESVSGIAAAGEEEVEEETVGVDRAVVATAMTAVCPTAGIVKRGR